jgi:hypothetical protein
VNSPAPSGKAKYSRETDSELVLRRKGEKYPEQGGEKNLKSYAYKRSESLYGMTACLLHNEPTSYSSLARLIPLREAAEAKASLNRAHSQWG